MTCNQILKIVLFHVRPSLSLQVLYAELARIFFSQASLQGASLAYKLGLPSFWFSLLFLDGDRYCPSPGLFLHVMKANTAEWLPSNRLTVGLYIYPQTCVDLILTKLRLFTSIYILLWNFLTWIDVGLISSATRAPVPLHVFEIPFGLIL